MLCCDVPCCAAGDADYDWFLSSHAPLRVLSSLAEYRLRAETYRTNAAMIAAHNAAPNRTYTLQMNRFGDWSRVGGLQKKGK